MLPQDLPRRFAKDRVQQTPDPGVSFSSSSARPRSVDTTLETAANPVYKQSQNPAIHPQSQRLYSSLTSLNKLTCLSAEDAKTSDVFVSTSGTCSIRFVKPNLESNSPVNSCEFKAVGLYCLLERSSGSGLISATYSFLPSTLCSSQFKDTKCHRF